MEGWWGWWVAPFNFIINQNPNAWIPRLEILDLYFRLDNTNVSDSKYKSNVSCKYLSKLV